MEDNLGEDVYKNCVCILSNSQNIISDMVKVRVDGKLFTIRIKESPRWTAFVIDNLKVELDGCEGGFSFGNNDNEDGNTSLNGKDEESLDPFGIYETMEQMKEEERRNKMSAGYKGWGKGKIHKNFKEDLVGAKWE